MDINNGLIIEWGNGTAKLGAIFTIPLVCNIQSVLVSSYDTADLNILVVSASIRSNSQINVCCTLPGSTTHWQTIAYYIIIGI